MATDEAKPGRTVIDQLIDELEATLKTHGIKATIEWLERALLG